MVSDTVPLPVSVGWDGGGGVVGDEEGYWAGGPRVGTGPHGSFEDVSVVLGRPGGAESRP